MSHASTRCPIVQGQLAGMLLLLLLARAMAFTVDADGGLPLLGATRVSESLFGKLTSLDMLTDDCRCHELIQWWLLLCLIVGTLLSM